MARPTTFDRQNSFTQFSSNYPSRQQSGTSLDAEFNAVKVSMDETQANLALIQDDDGALARGSVGRAQFDSSITLGFNSPEPWAADTAYEAFLDTVWYQGKFYTCVTDHTSAETFDTDKWFEVADLSVSASIEDGSITEEKLASSAVTADKIGALAVTTPKIASASVTNAKLADGAVTRDKISDDAGPDLAALILPVGLGPLPWSGRTAPTGWVLAGATYNREDYPALWTFAEAEIAASNTLYGVGDGSTTFTIADPKGRALVGVDSGASVLGSVTTPGATTGSATHTLTTAEIPSHTHINTLTDPGHAHTITASSTNAPLDVQAGAQNVGASPTANSTLSAVTGISINNVAAGGGGAHSIVQPVLAVNFIIKAH